MDFLLAGSETCRDQLQKRAGHCPPWELETLHLPRRHSGGGRPVLVNLRFIVKHYMSHRCEKHLFMTCLCLVQGKLPPTTSCDQTQRSLR